jgi:hypothetical protein
MHLLSCLLGVLLIATVLWDAFETVVLPRTLTRRFRLSRGYFRTTWKAWGRAARLAGSEVRREKFLAVYGPLSLLGLTMVWACALIAGFAALQWCAGSQLRTPAGPARFIDDLYMSGTTFVTLGLGDVQPTGRVAQLLTVAEGGTGFAFLAVVIAYLPVVYQSFSRREVQLTLLDAWAGSPPAAAEVLTRLAGAGELRALEPFLKDWEHWCSEILESHISYPAVAFFRSQHQRQSWVSALGTVLDLSALVIVGIEGLPKWQARVTFAIARHAAVDLTQVLYAHPDMAAERLSPRDLEELRRQLENAGLRPDRSADADAQLLELRRSYEPYVVGLSRRLIMPVSSWWRPAPRKDNWQTSPRAKGGTHL